MSYKAGIVKAIAELKDRTGSSSIAIKKHMQANLPKDKKWLNGMFLSALKKAVADGDLTKVKGSYKLSPAYKAKAAAAAKPKKAPKKKAVSLTVALHSSERYLNRNSVLNHISRCFCALQAPKKKKATKKKTAPKKKAVSLALVSLSSELSG